MDPRWRRLQLLHRLSFGLWLGWLPFVMLIVSVQDRYLPPRVGLVVILVYMAAFAIPSWVFTLLTCPNCGKSFAFGGFAMSRWRWQAPWAPRCVNCDARIGDPIEQSRN